MKDLLAKALAGRRLAYVAPDLGRTLGLRPFVPDLVVVCADAMGLGGAVDFPVLEVPAEGDDIRGSLSLLEDPRTQDFLRRERVTDLLLFKVNQRLVRRATDLGLRVLAGDAAVAQRFEHKLHFARIAAELGLATPETLLTEAGLPPFTEAAARLGSPLVVQAARGHSGQGTWLIEDPAAYAVAAAAIGPRGAARLSRLVQGTPLTLNGCALWPGTTFVGPPFYQITGLPEATPFPLGACGNVWDGARFRAPDLEAAAMAVGAALATAGYRGAFGLDAVRDPAGKLYLIEANPRVTSGLSMEALLQHAERTAPALALHVLAHLAPGCSTLPMIPGAPVGSQLVIYGTDSTDCRVEGAPRAGRYRIDGDRFAWLGPDADPARCAPGECVILPRSAGRLLPPGGEVVRLQVPWSLLQQSADAPGPEARSLARRARELVRLCDP